MKKILVIEDNQEVRENLCEILELASYEAYPAENGKIGVEKALLVNPDLILCDVMMPTLDGFGVLNILHKNPKTNHIPFIFLTAKAEMSDIRKGMGLGADDYITKPFDDTELLQAIEIRLEKHDRIHQSFDGSDQGFQNFISEAKAQKQFEQLCEDSELRQFNAKDSVYREGQIPRYLYFVTDGKFKCYQVNDLGKELITHIYQKGDFFGFYALLDEHVYSDNVSALEDGNLRLVSKKDFLQLLHNSHDFSATFIKMLANKAEETEYLLIEKAYSSVRRKVANALLTLSKGPDGIFDKKIALSREDMASLAGTAKETLIRTLSDFKSEGLITTDNKTIIIQDYEKLKAMPD